MSDRNQKRTVSDTTLLNYFVKTIGIQIGVVFAVIALLFIVFLSYQSVFSTQEQEQSAPASSEDAAPESASSAPVDLNVPNTLNSVRSQYSFKELYFGNVHPDVWYDDYTLWSNTKKRAIAKYGGSEETERAVELALQWLKSRQSADGAWSINNDNPMPSLNVNGATGLALLPFLTADGLKWTDGLECSSEYKDAVENGLNYLIQHGKTSEDFNGVRYCEPDEPLYNHVLATLALGEAYVMTRNNAYLEPAQGALEYILYSQNPDSGIWDGSANPPIYTANAYWNVETLRVYSKLHIYKKSSYDSLGKTTQNVRRFLDSIQNATTNARSVPDSIAPKAAQEILLRMYLYRFDAISDLEDSVERLCKTGLTSDSYYNYIATQIAFHYGGAPWKDWNAAMREKLINSQIQEGKEAGSWDFSKEQNRQNVVFPSSPLIDTALSALTLETYYRYKPLYHDGEYRKGFPLE
ncbi:MAG: terpene cyclase/mutase family protein [Thermoguttaceae bacterium]|nr:terpene cyclase/mutase family protein [Thermoguttaceae bacterium]